MNSVKTLIALFYLDLIVKIKSLTALSMLFYFITITHPLFKFTTIEMTSPTTFSTLFTALLLNGNL